MLLHLYEDESGKSVSTLETAYCTASEVELKKKKTKTKMLRTDNETKREVDDIVQRGMNI